MLVRNDIASEYTLYRVMCILERCTTSRRSARRQFAANAQPTPLLAGERTNFEGRPIGNGILLDLPGSANFSWSGRCSVSSTSRATPACMSPETSLSLCISQSRVGFARGRHSGGQDCRGWSRRQ